MKTQHEKDLEDAMKVHGYYPGSESETFAAGAAHGRKQVIARLRAETRRVVTPLQEFLTAITDLMEIVFK